MEFRLFVIDSSPAIHRLVEEAASTEGFECTAFSDGPSCLDEASRNQPQMIIADFHLEGITFTTFCDRLRDMNLLPSTLLMVLVNSSDRHDENGLRQRGVSAFIHKPVQVEQLRQTIKDLNESHMAAKEPKPARPRRSWPPESVTMGDDAPSVVEDAPAPELEPVKEDKVEIREPVARMSLPPGPASGEDLRPAAAAAAVAARNHKLRSGEPAAPAPTATPETPFKKDPSFSPPRPAAPVPPMPSPPSAPRREPTKDQPTAFAFANAAEPPPDKPEAVTRQPSKEFAPDSATAKAPPSPPAPPSRPLMSETRTPSKDSAPAFAAAKTSPAPSEIDSPPPARTPPSEPRAPSKDYAATVAAIQAAATPPEDLSEPERVPEAAAPKMEPQPPQPMPSPPKASPVPAQPTAPATTGNGERGGNGGQGLPNMLEESMRGFLANLVESLSQGSQAQIAQLVSSLVAEQVNAELNRKIQSEVAAQVATQVAAALPRQEIARLAQQAAQEQLPGLVAQHVDAMERSVKQDLTERTGEMVKDVTRKLLPEVTEPVLQRQLPDMVQQHMGLVDGLVKEAAQQAATGYTAEVAEKVIRQVASEQVAKLVTDAVADIAEAQVKQELARLTSPE